MRRCCPALCIRTAIDGTAIDATGDTSAALAPVPVPPAAVSRPPLLVLVLLQRRPAPPAPAAPPHKMAAGGSGGPGGLSSSCPQPPPPPPGNGAAAAACTNGAPASPPGLTYNQSGAANPPAASGGAGGPAAAGVAGAAGGAGGPGGALQREPVYNWQATKPTVQERFAFLFNNEVLSDVHFLVGKGRGSQRIPAHRWGGGRGDPTRGEPAVREGMWGVGGDSAPCGVAAGPGPWEGREGRPDGPGGVPSGPPD